MSITEVIPSLGTVPTTADPASFDARADTLLGTALPAFRDALNIFATQANAFEVAGTLSEVQDTSTTSIAIGTGEKVFTITAGKSFVAGMTVLIADAAAPSTNAMLGIVDSYSGTTLTMSIGSILGNGTKTSWVISQSAPGGATLSSNTFTGLQNFKAGADIASATAIDLTAATGNTIAITGTTETTSLTMTAGQQMLLLPSGAWPMTFNSTTMNINGDVDYTCAAGDRVWAAKDLAGVIRITVIKQDGTSVVAAGVSSLNIAKLQVSNWATRTSATDNGWNSIAWNGTVFAAVAGNGAVGVNVMTSPDGTTWTSRTSASAENWFGIAWSGTVFAAVAASGAVMTSPDGITWTGRTSATSEICRAIAWNGTVFAAVTSGGTGNRVMTSPDGTTWTLRTSAADNSWEAIAWNGTVFAAVATSGTGNRVMTSPDGITWTIRTSAEDVAWGGIAWNGTVFAAVATSGTGVMTSPDGITWTSRTASDSSAWKAIAWNGAVFVATSRATGDRVMYSEDGITWASASSSDNTLSWGALAWNGLGTGTTLLTPASGTGTVFAAVSSTGTGNRVMTSLFYKQ